MATMGDKITGFVIRLILWAFAGWFVFAFFTVMIQATIKLLNFWGII